MLLPPQTHLLFPSSFQNIAQKDTHDATMTQPRRSRTTALPLPQPCQRGRHPARPGSHPHARARTRHAALQRTTRACSQQPNNERKRPAPHLHACNAIAHRQNHPAAVPTPRPQRNPVSAEENGIFRTSSRRREWRVRASALLREGRAWPPEGAAWRAGMVEEAGMWLQACGADRSERRRSCMSLSCSDGCRG